MPTPTLHTCRSCHSSLLNPVWSVLLLPLSAAPHNSSCLRCECSLPAPTPAVKQPCTLSLHVVKGAMLLHAKNDIHTAQPVKKPCKEGDWYPSCAARHGEPRRKFKLAQE